MVMPSLSSSRPAFENRSDRRQEPRPPGTALPGALVRRIIGYLPVSMHGQCARVSRSWQASVPDSTAALRDWWHGLSLLQQHRCRHLAAAYSERLRPFLQASRDPLLPVTDCQYQELQRLQAGPGQPAYGCLSALLGWRLQQRWQDPDPLALPEVPVAENSGPVLAAGFSACSRWLALASQAEASQGPACLRLYGWHQGGWQAQRLQRSRRKNQQERPVEQLLFSTSDPDRLCTSHGGGVISWSRQPDTGVWQPVTLLPDSGRHHVTDLVVYGHHHLMLVYEESGRAGRGLVLLHDEDASQNWQLRPVAWYQQLAAIAVAPAGPQVAMAVVESDADQDRMVLDIWQQDPQVKPPGGWRCRPSWLEDGKQVLQLHYSPDGRHLLGFLTGQRACLWQVDAERRLHLCLDVDCQFSAAGRDLEAQRPFAGDGRRLALAVSMSAIRLYDHQDSGGWQQGDTLREVRPEEAPQDMIRYILFSGDGRMLLQVSYTRIHLWQRMSSGGFLVKKSVAGTVATPALPQAFLLPPLNSVCAVTAPWQSGKLWLHALDGRGRISQKSRTPSHDTPLSALVSSRDGLSQLVISGRPDRATVRQLTTVEQACRPQAPARQLSGPVQAAGARPMPETGWQGLAQTLPADLLTLIFSLLPLSGHGCCALVCRHWYRCLPDTRFQLARWREQHAPRPRPDLYQLADSYEAIARPRLRAGRCSRLPVLDGLYRRFRSLSAQAEPEAFEAARRTLAGLVHDSLHRQQRLADRLTVQVAVIHGSIRTSTLSRLSYCGRWLATALRPDAEGGVYRLHIHGWTAAGWQPQRLGVTIMAAVDGFDFCSRWADTLISHHVDDRLLSWSRDPGTGVWQASLISGTFPPFQLRELFPMPDGDIVRVYRNNAGQERLVLTPWCGPANRWNYSVGLRSPVAFGPRALAATSSQFICTMPPVAGTSDQELDIWIRDPVVPGEWIRREAAATCGSQVLRLIYSPDGSHLLGLLAGQRARLWQVEARFRLRQRLDMAWCYCHENDFRVWQPFREDGRQLAMASSTAQIQLWDRQPGGDWTPGDIIVTSTSPVSRYAGRIRYFALSADGRTLLRCAPWELAVWRRADPGGWQQVFIRTRQPGETAFPNGWLVPAGGPLCVTVAGNEGRLWVHAPDSAGRLVRKAECCLGQSVRWLRTGPDGQTLRFLMIDGTPALVQLGFMASPCPTTTDER